MTRRGIIIVAGLLILCGTLTQASIMYSKHDFRNQGWAGGQICLPCHAPHNNRNAVGTLLWNHTASTATYEFYYSPTMKAPTPLAMSPVSRNCMGCHDGTVALDAFGSAEPSTYISQQFNLGTVLVRDHPVSIDYTTALAASKGNMVDPSTPGSSGLGRSIDEDLLFDKKVECSSCHDVHNKYNNNPGMLKKSNDGSALCLTCHDV
jgi:predicted CXXCH cytochrome family protein